MKVDKNYREGRQTEVDWWLSFGTKRICFLAHVDFFELIWRCFCKSIHEIQFNKALEIGPGATGGFLCVIQHIRSRFAIDINVDDLREIGFLPSKTHIKYKQGDAEEMPYGDNTFDLVIMANTLDHVDHPKKVIKEIKRVLRPEGYLLFQTFLNIVDPHPLSFESPKEVNDMIDMKIVEEHLVDDNYKHRDRNDYYVAIYANTSKNSSK